MRQPSPDTRNRPNHPAFTAILLVVAAVPIFGVRQCPTPLHTELELGISLAEDEEMRLSYDVPPGATELRFSLVNVVGDPDLYVALGRPPSLSDYDCRPYETGNVDEFCDMGVSPGGTYHVLIHGYTDVEHADFMVWWRPPASVCGNSSVEGGEECDDGNTDGADGCSETCELETVDPADCLQEHRFIVQWTDVPHFSGAGGPYTFQAVLYENGDILFQYGDVEPYEATATIGLQTAAGAEALPFGFNSPFAADQSTVSITRAAADLYIADYSSPVYWLDIRDVGFPLQPSDDEEITVPLGFDFPLFADTYDSVAVSSNGFLGLTEPFGTYQNDLLPAPSLGAFIAPLWDDFNPSVGGQVHYYVAPPTCETDCNGVLGGFGVPDECGTCATGLETEPAFDCTGLCGGTAVIDGCGRCAGGTTGLEPMDLDCSGECGGTAYVDACNVCVGGNTGLDPSDPGACPLGVDLIVDHAYFESTIELDHVIVGPSDCLIAEGCVQGPGDRKVIRFGTKIANVGTEDLQLGVPGEGIEYWHYDECHSHYHFEAYAAYNIFDVGNDQMLEIGSKNGFCVLDTDVYDSSIAPDGCLGYNCGNQGITRGCMDIYHSGLQCQWIDVTGLPDGTYDLIVTTNPEQEIPEISYFNNTATVRVQLQGETVTVVP